MSGLAEIEIPGCEVGCAHVWGEEQRRVMTGGGVESSTLGVLSGGHGMSEDGHKRTLERSRYDASQGSYCQLCGGWRGSYGLEPTVEAYVGHTVAICRELWRVLREDGTLWWNLGDSYAANRTYQVPDGKWQDVGNNGGSSVSPGLKPKDLIGIPWRVALALQADGWYLRSDIIWAKGISFCPTYSGSCMPESVTDRPTNGHEHVFLLAKSKRYFYDADAVKESYTQSSLDRFKYTFDNSVKHGAEGNVLGRETSPHSGILTQQGKDTSASRNLRNVWTINPGSYSGAHFATFPPALVEPMIKAGTSQKGCCPECGAPWERVTEKIQYQPEVVEEGVRQVDDSRGDKTRKLSGREYNEQASTTTTGWTPTCSCDAGPPIPATVLDIFAGSGTTLAVADLLNRHSVGIELSQTYCDEHIIPRLKEPLFDWVEQEPETEPEPEPIQMELL